MKKIILIMLMVVSLGLASCTKHARVRNFGDDMTITLPAGYKLVEVTWKESSIWYLIEPMDSTYTPKTKIFKEDSRFGMFNGSITFIESK